MAKAKETVEEVVEAYNPNELVKIRLFKDNGKYKEPLFVAVNGKNIYIPRGEEVEIKRMFWDVIQNSQTQDAATALLISELAK